jgi:hypothetical protein
MDTGLVIKNSVVDGFLKQAAPPLALMTEPPSDPMEREEIGNQLWGATLKLFRDTLSENDKRLWNSPPANISQSPEHMRILHTFDDFLLGQFAKWGWRLLMSPGALQRLAEWEKHKPALLARFGRELELKSKVFRGEKSSVFEEDIDIFADLAIDDLKRLLQRQRDEFGRRPVSPDSHRLAAWMKLEIESEPAKYPTLSQYILHVCGWVESLPHRNQDMAKTLLRGDMRAPGFFYQFYADCMNRSAKDVKNETCRRRKLRSSHQSNIQKKH